MFFLQAPRHGAADNKRGNCRGFCCTVVDFPQASEVLSNRIATRQIRYRSTLSICSSSFTSVQNNDHPRFIREIYRSTCPYGRENMRSSRFHRFSALLFVGIATRTSAYTFFGAISASAADAPFHVSQILLGTSLHHTYTPSGSTTAHSEALSDPDDISRLGSDLSLDSKTASARRVKRTLTAIWTVRSSN